MGKKIKEVVNDQNNLRVGLAGLAMVFLGGIMPLISSHEYVGAILALICGVTCLIVKYYYVDKR